MNKSIAPKKDEFFKGPLARFFSRPDIAMLSQATPITAGIATYLSTGYAQEQYRVLESFMHELHEKVESLEESKIDREFLESEEGKRTIGKIFRLVLRDNRKEKIKSAAQLTANIFQKNKISFDEKELFVDILDGLNTLQLAILSQSVNRIRTREGDNHRGIDWTNIYEHFGSSGISKNLFTQSLRVLESNGLINKNTATVVGVERTHFVTEFGEQFFDYISSLE